MDEHEGDRMLRKTKTLARAMIPKEYRTPMSRLLSKTSELLHENWKRIWILVLWQMINIFLFTWKFLQHRNRPAFEVMGYCLCAAKGTAEIIKFNMALILLPVCKRTLTIMRETFFGSIIPFDDNINFHQWISLEIAIGTVIHTIMHLSCNYVRIASCPTDQFHSIFGPAYNYQQPTYMSIVSSTVGITGILITTFMTFAFTLATHWFRRNIVKLRWPFHHLAGFNAFWYAHHLLVLVYFLLIIHDNLMVFTREWYKKSVRL